MRLNFALLRANHEKTAGTMGTTGTPCIGAASGVPKVSADLGTTGDSPPRPSAFVPSVPKCPQRPGTLKPSNGGLSPVSPLSPARNGEFAPLAILAANDPAPAARFVLTYEVDGRQATCVDPISPTMGAAVADLGRLYGLRLGRVWCRGELVRDMPRH